MKTSKGDWHCLCGKDERWTTETQDRMMVYDCNGFGVSRMKIMRNFVFF